MQYAYCSATILNCPKQREFLQLGTAMRNCVKFAELAAGDDAAAVQS